MWVARPAPGGFGCEQILPVDYAAITQGGSTATNYQIMSGDRVFIESDRLIAMNNFVTSYVPPVERLLGVASLSTSFARSARPLAAITTEHGSNELRNLSVGRQYCHPKLIITDWKT